MKAEHRKELQTNALADRMGKMLQSIKTKPQKRTYLWVIGTAVAILALIIIWRYRQAAARDNSDLWVEFEDGNRAYIDKLVDGPKWPKLGKGPETKADYGLKSQGKAARFQLAYITLWEEGIKSLAARHQLALLYLDIAQDMYTILSDECKGDPVWHPEALYNLAVIEETRAVVNRDHLAKARQLYEEVARDYKDSAHGKLASERAELLKKDSPSYQEVARFYADFQSKNKIEEKKLKQ